MKLGEYSSLLDKLEQLKIKNRESKDLQTKIVKRLSSVEENDFAALARALDEQLTQIQHDIESNAEEQIEVGKTINKLEIIFGHLGYSEQDLINYRDSIDYLKQLTKPKIEIKEVISLESLGIS